MANTERMNEPTLAERVLVALFRRGQRNESIDIFGLAQDCEASLFAVLKIALCHFLREHKSARIVRP